MVNLNAEVAQDIVSQLEEIIGESINLMNRNGEIVASTDTLRIGTLHSGAIEVIKTQKELIIKEESTFEGAKPGINLPLMVKGEILGVVGVTGQGDAVEKYGSIIKKMTEILLKEYAMNQNQQIYMDRFNQLVDTLITTPVENIDSIWINNRMADLKIDETLNRSIVIMGSPNQESLVLPNRSSYVDMLKTYITPKDHALYYAGHFLIWTCEVNTKVLESKLSQLSCYFANEVQTPFHFGVGRLYGDILDMKHSYQEAKIAYKSAIDKSERILFYADLDIEMLVDSIPTHMAKRFCDKVLNQLTDEDLESYSQLLEVFVRHNGSISKAADELYIHKNTYQYRLNKLGSLTGYNPRELKDLIRLSFAFKLVEKL